METFEIIIITTADLIPCKVKAEIYYIDEHIGIFTVENTIVHSVPADKVIVRQL